MKANLFLSSSDFNLIFKKALPISASNTNLLVLKYCNKPDKFASKLVPGKAASLREGNPLVFNEQLNTGLIFVVLTYGSVLTIGRCGTQILLLELSGEMDSIMPSFSCSLNTEKYLSSN